MKHRELKRTPGRQSIRRESLISHIALALLVIFLATTLCYILTYYYLRSVRVDETMHNAVTIAEFESGEENAVLPDLEDADIYRKLTDAYIFCVDMNGESIRLQRYSAKSEKLSAEDNRNNRSFVEIELLDKMDKQFISRVLSGERVSDIRHFEFADGVVLFAGAPIYDAEQNVVGGIVLAQPVSIMRGLSRAILLLVLITAGISILMAVFLSLQFSGLLVRPLERMTLVARRMTEGSYTERVSIRPSNEIGELGEALNVMAGRLNEVIENLREEKEKLELVISGIGEGVLAVNQNMEILHSNQMFSELSETAGVERFFAEGGPFAERLTELIRHCMTAGTSASGEWTSPSGRMLQVSVSALIGDDGEKQGAVCLLRDVSEEQRLEKLRRDYVANISHELRTPLTGIRGMVEPLMDGCMETEAERQESYRIILKETVRLQKLVGEMLDMSRLQDGRVVLETEALELPGILEAAVRSMKPIADRAGIALGLETDGSRLDCFGNEDRITQVLIIMLDNALSFTPEGGTVTVSARSEKNCARVSVSDTGAGIDPHDLPLIWERFYKADKSRMRTTGTGLGLSIAKLVVELMGGRIGVESEYGSGAVFSFTLPRGEQE